MDKYLLDTNICIFFLRGKYDVDKQIRSIGIDNCCISEITIAELLYGVECDLLYAEENKKRVMEFVNIMSVIPISNALPVYAKEKFLLRKSGTLIDDMDIFIGATAIANDMILVTDNEKHLNRLSKIKIENWIERKN
ncbi:MAG: type II toxin-antitoxin system VapC family toxin [Tannerellaceae bacterium]|nr:type II toxin-antitoxin system VapC family toxin [Tannerellaceae bacterium]